MWEIRIQHEGLRAFRVVKGATQEDAELKAEAQMEIWNQRWNRRLNVERANLERLGKALNIEQAKHQARTRAEEAANDINAIESLLKTGVTRGKFFSWNDLKDRSPFAEPPLNLLEELAIPQPPSIDLYSSQLSLLDRLISSRRLKKEEAATNAYETAHVEWNAVCERISAENSVVREKNKLSRTEIDLKRAEYKARQARQHSEIDLNAAAFSARSTDMIEYFFSEILTRSTYPESFPEEARLQYQPDTSILIVDYELPNVTAMPAYKDVKFIAARKIIQEVSVTETWLKKAYDDALYQTALRTLYELFVHDETGILKGIVFNGWVRSVDKSTGFDTHACIMSIHAEHDEFMAINLEQVDPKSCFRKLKGVGSSKLIELMPIRPVMSVSREDSRFVDGYAVLSSVDDRTNLASMDWLDFENLIREVFEKEFSKNGGEVKITQASRDGGVDAIAFDPDPIRGGKIVIQAKRYTNVVGVSAVRDLYGTVHNEGAIKGILVTTSSYGPDAYEFAKNKPISLLSGSELLYLLEKHGHKAKIDLAAARIEYKENQKSPI